MSEVDQKVTLKQVRSVVEMWAVNNRTVNSEWHGGFVSACEAVLDLMKGNRRGSIVEAEKKKDYCPGCLFRMLGHVMIEGESHQ